LANTIPFHMLKKIKHEKCNIPLRFLLKKMSYEKAYNKVLKYYISNMKDSYVLILHPLTSHEFCKIVFVWSLDQQCVMLGIVLVDVKERNELID